MVDGFDGWGRVLVEAIDREEYLWGDGLLTGGYISVESSHLMLNLDDEIVRHNTAVMQIVVDFIVGGDSQDFHIDGVVTVEGLPDIT